MLMMAYIKHNWSVRIISSWRKQRLGTRFRLASKVTVS